MTMDVDYRKGPFRSTLTLKGLKLKGSAKPPKFTNLHNWENSNETMGFEFDGNQVLIY